MGDDAEGAFDTVGLRDYIRLVTRRWPTILAVMLLSVVLAALATIRMTPTYESSIEMFVASSQSSSDAQYQNQLFSQQRAKSYARLLTGEDVAKRVVDDLRLPISADEFAQHVTAEVVTDTVILRATVSDESAKQAQLLASKLGEVFVGYIGSLETPEGQDTSPIKVSVVGEADLPGSPASPNVVLNIALGIIVGLILGLVVAAVREMLDNSIRTFEDVGRVIGAPALGTIEYDKAIPSQPLLTSLPDHHPRLEAIRILRTNLQFVDVDRSVKVIVVTSSVPGEGKSTTAANLALALAQSGNRVALVEGDMRRPRISEYLGVEGSVGLTTVLVGQVPLADAMQLVLPDGLEVLTSGKLPPNPSDIIQTQAMKDLMLTLRDTYDFVLVDAPPLLPVTDAALLAALADGAILIVRHGKTSRELVEMSSERLESVGARLLGVVINMVPQKGGSSYGYGYGYGYEPIALKPTTRKRARADAKRASRPTTPS